MRNVMFLAGLAALFAIFIYFITLYIEYKNIKVERSIKSKDLKYEDIQLKISQMKITKKVEQFGKDDVEELLLLSKNPMKISVSTYKMMTLFVPAVLMFLGLDIYLLTADYSYFIILTAAALLLAIVPKAWLKSIIEDRKIAWGKMYGFIWRLSEELEINDHKKAFMAMSNYFYSINEIELSEGFEKFYEIFPEDQRGIDKAIKELEKEYPFAITLQLYNLLLETWNYSQSSSERLNSFKESVILEYKRNSDKYISKIPMKGTLFSLPFLMLSVMIALLLPSLINIISMLG